MAYVAGKRFQKGDYTTPPGCTLTTVDEVVIELDLDVDYAGVNEDIQELSISIINSYNICVKKFKMSRCCLIAGTIIKPYSPRIFLPVGTYTIGGFGITYDYDCAGAPSNCGSSRMAEVSCTAAPPILSNMHPIEDKSHLYSLADCTTLTITQAITCTQPTCSFNVV